MATMTVKVQARVRGQWRLRFWGLMLRLGQVLRLDEATARRWYKNGVQSIRVEMRQGRGSWTEIGRGTVDD